VLTGAAAGLASLGLLVVVASVVTRRYDRRKLRQTALHSAASVSSAGILLDSAAAAQTGNGSSVTSSFAASVTFENRAALFGAVGSGDELTDFVAMFDSDDLDEIRATTATMHDCGGAL